jgi:hypothetical protein
MLCPEGFNQESSNLDGGVPSCSCAVAEIDPALTIDSPSARILEVSRSTIDQWACGAAGSALPWHGRGRRFDPDQVHQFPPVCNSPKPKHRKLLCVRRLVGSGTGSAPGEISIRRARCPHRSGQALGPLVSARALRDGAVQGTRKSPLRRRGGGLPSYFEYLENPGAWRPSAQEKPVATHRGGRSPKHPQATAEVAAINHARQPRQSAQYAVVVKICSLQIRTASPEKRYNNDVLFDLLSGLNAQCEIGATLVGRAEVS